MCTRFDQNNANKAFTNMAQYQHNVIRIRPIILIDHNIKRYHTIPHKDILKVRGYMLMEDFCLRTLFFKTVHSDLVIFRTGDYKASEMSDFITMVLK